MDQSLQNLANIATIFALLWAIYEFILKRKTLVKASLRVLPLIQMNREKLLVEINLYNSSQNKPITINQICAEIKSFNSNIVCFSIDQIFIQPFGNAKITYDLNNLFKQLPKKNENKLFNKLFPTKINIFLTTTSGDIIYINIDDFYQKEILHHFKRI